MLVVVTLVHRSRIIICRRTRTRGSVDVSSSFIGDIIVAIIIIGRIICNIRSIRIIIVTSIR